MSVMSYSMAKWPTWPRKQQKNVESGVTRGAQSDRVRNIMVNNLRSNMHTPLGNDNLKPLWKFCRIQVPYLTRWNGWSRGVHEIPTNPPYTNKPIHNTAITPSFSGKTSYFVNYRSTMGRIAVPTWELSAPWPSQCHLRMNQYTRRQIQHLLGFPFNIRFSFHLTFEKH